MAEVHTQHSLLPNALKQSLHSMEREDYEKELSRIPFAENTHVPKFPIPEKVPSLVEYSNKENSPKGVKSRSRIKLLTDPNQNHILNTTCSAMESSNEMIERPCTPTSDDQQQAPLTPTANLTVLMNAISPELRNRDKQKKSLFEIEDNSDDTFPEIQPLDLDKNLEDADLEQDASTWKPGSRKDKSLGLLCQKFLQKYPECPKSFEKVTISLDEVAKDLGVERRRIYDIVNVLESVEIVSRIAKNKYAWHGKTNLLNTLTKLKALGEAEGFAEQLVKIRDYEMNRELEEQNGGTLEFPPDLLKSESAAMLRKDKSLGIMSQKFLMLFLVSKPKTVNLDLAAKILIGDPNVDRTENSKFKTKIRRLYDIANILTSLNLIHKTHVTEVRGRKPAFKYIGPELDSNPDLSVSYNENYHRPVSRHSLLDGLKNKIDMTGVGDASSSSIGFSSSQPTSSTSRVKQEKKSFIRTASFDQICQIAEKEIIKINSLSQPASPNSSPTSRAFTKSLSQDSISLLSVGSQEKSNRSMVLQKLDKKCEVLPPNQKYLDGSESSKKKIETAILDKPNTHEKPNAGLSLTQSQIEAVLKSLKEPVSVNKKANLDTKCLVGLPAGKEIMIGDKKVSVRTISITSSNKRPASPILQHERSKFIKLSSSPQPENENKDISASGLRSCLMGKSNLSHVPLVSPGSRLETETKGEKKILLRLPDKVLQVTSAKKVQSPVPQIQVLQGVPGNIQGQKINFLTFSPPITPKSTVSSPTLFSFTSSQAGCMQGQSGVSHLQSPATHSPLPTPFITPTERPSAPTGKLLEYTPGGYFGNMYPTARKLDLKLPENSA